MSKSKVFKKRRDIMLIVLIVILMGQMLFYKTAFEAPYNFNHTINKLEDEFINSSDVFIKDTIRAEQRRVLLAIRQSWLRYLELHPDTTITIDKNKWNYQSINDMLGIIAGPIRMFDSNSDILVYDINTGEILFAPSFTQEQLDCIKINGKPNIRAFYKLSTGIHADQVKDVAELLMEKIDTDRNTGITSLIYEKEDINKEDINDFKKHPLGTLNRVFIEKIVLPHESLQFDKNMQLGVMVSLKEQEIFTPYVTVENNIMNELKALASDNESLRTVMNIMIVLNFLCIIACTLYTKIIGYGLFEEE